MKYIDYINHLKSNNIILFDHDYRLSYSKIKTYYNNYYNQSGGGNNNHKLSNKFLNLSKDELKYVIDIALSSNPHYLSYLTMH